MNAHMNPDELRRQEAVRDRVYDKQVRWNDLMARIRWAEQQVRRATPAACLAKQRRFAQSSGDEQPER